jgi:hypothetical protein
MKATRAQVQARVEEVLAIRLDGAQFWHVREYAREKEREEESPWHLKDGQKPLSDGQLWRYIRRADQMLADSCRASRKKLLRRHLAQRRHLYAKAVSQGDTRAALAALDSEAKLIGLFPAERAKVELGGKDGGPVRVAFSVEEAVMADKELEKWERERMQPPGGEPVPGGDAQVP